MRTVSVSRHRFISPLVSDLMCMSFEVDLADDISDDEEVQTKSGCLMISPIASIFEYGRRLRKVSIGKSTEMGRNVTHLGRRQNRFRGVCQEPGRIRGPKDFPFDLQHDSCIWPEMLHFFRSSQAMKHLQPPSFAIEPS